MANPYIGEIRLFPFNFAPVGWALCNGQLLAISQNTALFSILGTMYGGNGTSNFALPNLQGAVPMGAGQGSGLSLRDLGESGGESAVILPTATLPAHTHTIGVSTSAGTTDAASGSTAVGVPPSNAFGAAFNLAPMAANAGGGEPHNNMQPYLALNFCIALQGVYPPRL